MSLQRARAVADAVLYEGYLLYPYRASARKNQVRWQFGVLGPPGAVAAGVGEDSSMATECLLLDDGEGAVRVELRFLQVQTRTAEQADPTGAEGYRPVEELRGDDSSWLTWDEAVEHEISVAVDPLGVEVQQPLEVPGGVDIEPVHDRGGAVIGRLVRRRRPIRAGLRTSATVPLPGLVRLRVQVDNLCESATDRDDAVRRSMIGAHLLIVADGARFVSLLEPPAELAEQAAACTQHRCFPVLVGRPGDTDVVLVSPIILYDYPEIAEQSAGALFDSTEIDEILTLRTMTLTEEEKAAARATDPRAAAIIDRCEQLSPEQLQAMHGVLRDPRGLPADDESDVPWWDPEVDAGVDPETDSVLVRGVAVTKGSSVRLHPSRRADAHDIFYDGQVATVTAVVSDVDGETHVAVVLDDDPAAELHDWYGRYLYFAPDELEPLVDGRTSPMQQRQEEPS